MATTPLGIAFEEIDDSPSLTIRADGSIEAKRKFKTTWADRLAFANELRGYWFITGTQTFQQAPANFPGIDNSIIDTVSIVPFVAKPTGSSTLLTQHSTHEHAQIDVTYQSMPDIVAGSRNNYPSVPNGTFLTLSGDIGAQFVTQPERIYRWDGDNIALKPDEHPAVRLPLANIVFTWSRVPRPPWSAIYSTAGKINNATFFNNDIGKVSFDGCRPTETFQYNGQTNRLEMVYSLEYHFKARSERWDYNYRDTAHAFAKYEKSDGSAAIELTDFSALFQFA